VSLKKHNKDDQTGSINMEKNTIKCFSNELYPEPSHGP